MTYVQQYLSSFPNLFLEIRKLCTKSCGCKTRVHLPCFADIAYVSNPLSCFEDHLIASKVNQLSDHDSQIGFVPPHNTSPLLSKLPPPLCPQHGDEKSPDHLEADRRGAPPEESLCDFDFLPIDRRHPRELHRDPVATPAYKCLCHGSAEEDGGKSEPCESWHAELQNAQFRLFL